jgi:hypothetical protein
LAQAGWFALLCGSIVVGVRALVRAARPKAGPELWAITSGVVLLSACVRWGMTPQQGAPLMLGLLCLFLAALHGERAWVALALAIVAVALKMTLALPFLALLVLHRRYAAVAATLAASAVFDVAGFVRVGGLRTLSLYQENVRQLEAFGDINTPDPWDPLSVARLDWTYLFYGLTGNLGAARLATLLLSGAVALWLLIEMLRVRRPIDVTTSAAFLAPTVLLGCACVYHHHYDISPFVAPLVVLALRARDVRPPAWTVAALAPLVVIMALLPAAQIGPLAVRLFGPSGVGLKNLMFPLSLSLAMAGSLAILRQTVKQSAHPRSTPLPDLPPVQASFADSRG